MNDCDAPYIPFPTQAPTDCKQIQYLQGNGTVYSPGYPYNPYGQEANQCVYIQKADEGLHPTMKVYYSTYNNFVLNSTISKFSFYASEDPSDEPFYT